MALFGKKEDGKTDAEKEVELKLQEEKLEKVLGKFVVFPGSKKEFEEYSGFETEYIKPEEFKMGDDTDEFFWKHSVGIRVKEDIYPFENLFNETQEKIANTGVVAIVNATIAHQGLDGLVYFGLPVKKREAKKKEGV